jgi:hypothetical protein
MAGKQVKSFRCPACGGQVELRAAGHTISAVCEHCSTVIDTANEQFRIIKKDHQRSRQTDIPIGAKGLLDGVKWEVIGYVEKKDLSSQSFWEEYLLFNPYFGFRFLVQADDHWSLASIIKRDFPLAGGSTSEFQFDDEKYSVFYRGQSKVEYVLGEFYWRIRTGDQESYTDYIAPPKMLTVEKSKQEVTLSLAEYLLPEEVEKAFQVTLSKRTGVAPNQPPPFARVLSGMWKVTLYSLLAALIIQLNSGSNTVLNNTSIHIEQENPGKSFSTAVFSVPRQSNLVVHSVAPLRNSWMDLDISLANESTHRAYAATQAIEYYYGVDDGESWSEGNTQDETYFSAVDSGDYRLLVEPSPGSIGPSGMDMSVEIKYNVAVWSNFWMIAFLILVLPIYAVIYRWYFEYKRWENSDYAPAIYRISSEDD